MRYSHANEAPISRENEGEDAPSGCQGCKVCTGTGLIKTSSAGTCETGFRSGRSTGERSAGTSKFGAPARRAHCQLLGWGAYLCGGEHGVLVQAEHCVSDDVVIGQETAAHDLGGRRQQAEEKELGKREVHFEFCSSGQFTHPQPSEKTF